MTRSEILQALGCAVIASLLVAAAVRALDARCPSPRPPGEHGLRLRTHERLRRDCAGGDTAACVWAREMEEEGR